jgi:hypothetical protein
VPSTHPNESTSPIPDLPAHTAGFDEHAAVLGDIRVAEDQIARGEGVEHDLAKQQVLGRLRR